MSRIVVIQGHPDNSEEHFCHALASAYERGAHGAGHQVSHIDVATVQFPLLRSRKEWEAPIPESLGESVKQIVEADHLVIIYPLWLGTMPALLKGFLEQIFRPGVALRDSDDDSEWPKSLLRGKSCRVVVTMGMPGFFYRWYYRAHSLKSLERNILKLSGVAPVRSSVFGLVEGVRDDKRQYWLKEMEALGQKAN